MLKTYVSDKPHLTMSHTPYGKDPATDRRIIDFVNGSFSTEDAEIQKFIEERDCFGKSVRLAPSDLEIARAKAKELRAAAVKAVAAADAADKAAKELEPRTAAAA